DKGAAESNVRPEAEQHRVGVGGDQVFLDEQFEAVGDGLEPTEEAADAGGAEPGLDAAADPARQPDEGQGGEGHDGNEEDRVNKGRDTAGPVRAQAERLE